MTLCNCTLGRYYSVAFHTSNRKKFIKSFFQLASQQQCLSHIQLISVLSELNKNVKHLNWWIECYAHCYAQCVTQCDTLPLLHQSWSRSVPLGTIAPRMGPGTESLRWWEANFAFEAFYQLSGWPVQLPKFHHRNSRESGYIPWAVVYHIHFCTVLSPIDWNKTIGFYLVCLFCSE